MTKLKDYNKHGLEKAKLNTETRGREYEPTGIASPECEDGEMLIVKPIQHHPEIKGLRRAVCSKTGWKGWA